MIILAFYDKGSCCLIIGQNNILENGINICITDETKLQLIFHNSFTIHGTVNKHVDNRQTFFIILPEKCQIKISQKGHKY